MITVITKAYQKVNHFFVFFSKETIFAARLQSNYVLINKLWHVTKP